MSIGWEIFIYLVVAISVSTGYVLRAFYQEYIARVRTSKKTDKLSNIVIPPEVSELISRINLSTMTRVADDPEEIPNAATFHRHPSYIIISRLVLGKRNVHASQFELKHLLALVAHELGHIKLAGQSMWVQEMCMSGAVGALLFQLISSCRFAWTYLPYSLLAFVFFTLMFIIASWIDEYRADAFVIKDALIPVDDLARALIALKRHFDKKQNILNVRARKFWANITHPPVYYRIRRIRRLYNE